MGHDKPPEVDDAELQAWFDARIPSDWFVAPVRIVRDRDEILVIGTLPPDEGDLDLSDTERRARCEVRIVEHREQTRQQRIEIAAATESRFERKVSWGARAGDLAMLFTHLSIPAMTRLRLQERKVLDTLVDAGVARSRSEALAWCVRLVGRNLDEWLDDLRQALVAVEDVRRKGPSA
jgi:hypothetical protein